MKVIGFSQLRNELEKGNLENWFKCMLSMCDYIYIFDQNSTDGSIDYYKRFKNVIVIESKVNRFDEEMLCKNELLNKIKKDHPDTDFIQWLDGDELLDGRLINDNGKLFKSVCEDLLCDDHDGYSYGHKNLWRSGIYERVDSDYDWLDKNGLCKLWKFRKDLCFEQKVGLHLSNIPVNIKSIKRLPFVLVHRGFSTDRQIIDKYNLYKSFGQRGYLLDRFLDETTLTVVELDRTLLPEWFIVTDDINPINKKKLIDVYNEK